MKDIAVLPSMDGVTVTPIDLLSRYDYLTRSWYDPRVDGVAAPSGVPISSMQPLNIGGRRDWLRLWEGVRLYRPVYEAALQPKQDARTSAGKKLVPVQTRLDIIRKDQAVLDDADAAFKGGDQAARAGLVASAIASVGKSGLTDAILSFSRKDERAWQDFIDRKRTAFHRDLVPLNSELTRLARAYAEAENAYNEQHAKQAAVFSVAGISVSIDYRGWVIVNGRNHKEVRYNALADELTGEMVRRATALGDAPEHRHQALREQVDRIRQLTTGTVLPGITEAEVMVACTWFGAEVIRNPRSFGTGLMMLELLANRVPYGHDGAKQYDWANVLSGTVHAGEDDQAWAARLASHPRDPSVTAGKPAVLRKWGGKYPMAHQDSEPEGAEPIVAPLNVVQMKEVSLIAHWISYRHLTTWAAFDAAVTDMLKAA